MRTCSGEGARTCLLIPNHSNLSLSPPCCNVHLIFNRPLLGIWWVELWRSPSPYNIHMGVHAHMCTHTLYSWGLLLCSWGLPSQSQSRTAIPWGRSWIWWGWLPKASAATPFSAGGPQAFFTPGKRGPTHPTLFSSSLPHFFFLF